MSYEQDDDQQDTGQAFAGLKEHVDKYKTYIKKLKKGNSSGVSGVFGKASDLLPAEHLEEYMRGDKPFEVGESVVKDGADLDLLRQAVEDIILLANEGQEGELLGAAVDGREIIGVFFEDGKKMLMFSDFSLEEAPEPAAQMELELQAEADDGTPSLFQPHAQEAYESTFESESPETVAAEIPEQELDNAYVPSVPEEAAADLRVTTAQGDWLWDIYLDDGELVQAQMADGTVIQRAGVDQYVISRPPQAGQKMPSMEIVGSVSVDRETGNIYYQNQSGTQASALLNNGWRIDQHKKTSGDECFVTAPVKPGQETPVRSPVSNLSIDPETGDISYQTADGGVSATLSCRKLT